MVMRFLPPIHLVLGFLLLFGVFAAHGVPLLLGWGTNLYSNTGIMDPSMAIRLGYLKANVTQMTISEGIVHPGSLNYVDMLGNIWEPNLSYFSYDSNILDMIEPMAFEPSSWNAFFPSPVKTLVSGYQYMALLEDGSLYTWGGNFYQSGAVKNPTSLYLLVPSNTQYPIVPSINSTWTHLNSHSDGIFTAIDEDGVGMVFSSDSCSTGTGVSAPPMGSKAFPLDIQPSFGRVTLMSVRLGHGAAVIVNGDVSSVWAWGREKFAGVGSSLESCNLSPALVTSLAPNITITHLVTSFNSTFFVANNITVYRFGVQPPHLDTGFSNIASNGITIIKMVAASHTIHVLFSNGAVWSRTEARYENYGITPLLSQFYDVLSDETEGLYKADFGRALPPDHKIFDIEAKAGTHCVYALASPSTSAAPLNVPQMLPPVSNPHPNTLVYWGFCSFWSAGNYNYEDISYDSASFVFPTEIELRPLDDFGVASDEIKRWSSDGYHSLILTSNHVLTWGSSYPTGFGSIGPFSKNAYAKTPRILDSYFYGGDIDNVLDVASSNGTHMILLKNGSLVLWGTHSKYWSGIVPPPFEFRRDQSSNARTELTTSDTINRNFTSIVGNLGSIGAISAYGVWTWGSLAASSDTTSPYLQAFCLPRVISNLSVATDTLLALRLSPTPTVFFLYVDPAPLIYSCTQLCTDMAYPQFKTCQLAEPVGFSSAEIKSLHAFNGWYAAVTIRGAWVLGSPPFMPNSFFPAWSSVPLPRNVAWPSVKKVSFTSDNMYWLLTNGTLLATAGDGATLRARSYSLPLTFADTVHPVNIDSHVEEISTVAGNCPFAIVRRNSRPPSYAPYLTRFFGSTQSGQPGTGSFLYQAAMESGKLLPSGHPLESDTIDLFSVGGYVTIRDGNITGSATPRFMQWGGAGTIYPNTPIYLTPGLLREDPDFNFLHSIVAVSSQGLTNGMPIFVAALEDCSFYSHYGTPGSFDSATTDDPDPSYPFNFRRWFPMDFIVDIVSVEMPDCNQFHLQSGTSIVDMKCMSLYLFSPGTCFVLASSRKHIFLSFRAFSGVPVYDCESGFYGDKLNCSTNSQNSPFNQAVIQTDSLGASTTIAQFEIGQLHGLVLTEDGRLASWGSNQFGQLGIPGSDNSSTLQFISIPSAYAGAVTKIVTSRWNSYAVIDGRLVLSWGSNKLGGLGIGNTVSYSSTPMAVQAPAHPIRDLTCAASTCYLLFNNGETYTWGMSGGEAGKLLGRPFSERFASIPAPATLFTFPPPNRRVAQIMTSPYSYSIFVRGELYEGIIGPSDTCVGSPPADHFECVGGVWTIAGSVVVGGPNGTTPGMTITGPTTIIGNLTVNPGSVITVVNPSIVNSGIPVLNVTGCIQGDGSSFEITIDPKTFDTIKTNLGGKQVYLAESGCSITSESVVLSTPKDCRKVKATTNSEQRQGGRFGLNTFFTVDSKKCSTWWIVLLSVFGAVVILTLAAGLGWYIYRKRKYSNATGGD